MQNWIKRISILILWLTLVWLLVYYLLMPALVFLIVDALADQMSAIVKILTGAQS